MIFTIHHQWELNVIQCGIVHQNSYFVQLNDTEEVTLANYYKLETTSRMRKNGIQTVLIEYYIDEKIVSEDKSVIAETTSAVELKKLELREREKEREDQLCLKELEFKERELPMQLKIRD